MPSRLQGRETWWRAAAPIGTFLDVQQASPALPALMLVERTAAPCDTRDGHLHCGGCEAKKGTRGVCSYVRATRAARQPGRGANNGKDYASKGWHEL
jgi:hypothetical protein